MSENILVPTGITPAVGWRSWRASADETKYGVNMSSMIFYSTVLFGDTPKAKLPAPIAAPSAGLHSTTRDDVWPPFSPMQATCTKTHLVAKHSEYDPRTGQHSLKWAKGVRFALLHEYCPPPAPIPADECTCGIYAARLLSGASVYGSIWGRVALWGKVIVAEHGWRAQFAYPQALYVDDDKHKDIVGALSRYGVPVLKKSAIESLEAVPA